MALSKELLEQLLESTALLLQARIADGEATPADISNALRLLKDNDISVIVKDSDALQELNERLAKRKSKIVDLTDARTGDQSTKYK